MTNPFHFSEELLRAAEQAQAIAKPVFDRIDQTAQVNSDRVLAAFVRHGVAERHFAPTTGYGYGDAGRDLLDAVFAEALQAPDALVRPGFLSGTHALTTALFAALRPGDTLLACTGKPYDTLDEVIGLRGEGMGSLRDFGVRYEQLDLLPGGAPNLNALRERLSSSPVRVAYFQRSRGYAIRPSLSVAKLGEAARLVHNISPETIVMVDNCYGEFVETVEPTAAGADCIVGSLIKNPGGGVARGGGYIAGRADLVEAAACRFCAPGIGREAGANPQGARDLFEGLFLAPHAVAQALKTAVFAAALLGGLGYDVTPRFDEARSDIVQTLLLGSPERLVAFCRGLQSGSPVDSAAAPEPWDMPGYDSQVIMAAGAFTSGSSLELSADAPLREPYAAYLQGGLTYESGRTGVLRAVQALLNV